MRTIWTAYDQLLYQSQMYEELMDDIEAVKNLSDDEIIESALKYNDRRQKLKSTG